MYEHHLSARAQLERNSIMEGRGGESMTDEGLKKTCFKNIIHKGFIWKEARKEGEDKMEEKREQSCLVLFKRVVVGEADPPLGSYLCLSDPTLKTPTS